MSGRSEKIKLSTNVINGSEITVNLVLTIKLDGDNLSITTDQSLPKATKMKEKIDFIIPDIGDFEKIEFGDKVKQ